MTHKNDMIYLEQIRLSKIYYDTIPTIDTIFESGVAVYDTTFEYKKRGSAASQTEFHHDIPLKYLSDLPSAEVMTIMNSSYENDVFINGVKLTLDILLTDENYWKVFDHDIIEGRHYDQDDVNNAAMVIVISTKTAQNYFGYQENVVGKEMFIDGKNFKVIGLYENNAKMFPFVSPAALAPYTVIDLSKIDNFYFGPFIVMFKKKPNALAQTLKDEIKHASTLIPLDHPDNEYDFDEVVLRPATYNEMYANEIYYEEDAAESYKMMKIFFFSLLAFFILLPTLNLINLNVSRILDRSSEIGVRKAFGAHQGNIIYQFIIENIVQTLIGGLLGLLLAIGLIKLINSAGYLGEAILDLNWKFFAYSLIATLVFGILSGLLPAYKMSKLQIVNALKENKL